MELIPASNSYARAFLPGYDADGDSGGLVGEIYVSSLGWRLKTKSGKPGPSRKFDRWVLVLVTRLCPERRGLKMLDQSLWTLNASIALSSSTRTDTLEFEWPSASLRRS